MCTIILLAGSHTLYQIFSDSYPAVLKCTQVLKVLGLITTKILFLKFYLIFGFKYLFVLNILVCIKYFNINLQNSREKTYVQNQTLSLPVIRFLPFHIRL